MPLAMSVVWDAIKNPVKSKKIAKLLEKFDTVLALDLGKIEENKESEIPEEIIALAEERKKARQDKNWAESDRLRDEITAKGYTIKDNKDGYEIVK